MVSGVAWVAAVRWTSQVFRWLSTLVLAKLLLPADYGIVGMAMVLIGLVNQVAEFGLGAAVTQHRDLSRQTEERLAGMALLIAAGMTAIAVSSAPLAAAFFTQTALERVVPVLSVRFLIDAFATVPRAILARALRFRTLAIMEGVESLVMASASLLLAVWWRSYWALIAANVAGAVAVAVFVNLRAPVRPRWPRRPRELKSLLTFGRDLVLSRLAWFSYSSADFIVIGRMLGKEVLGAYTMAWNIASLPAEKLTGLVMSVAPGVFSHAREQPGELRRLYLSMLQLMSLITFPVAVGLALVAELVVIHVLDPKWADAVGPLRLLSLFFIFRAVAALDPVVLLARKETYIDRNFSLLFAIVMPVAFVIAARWGAFAVAAAWILVQPVISLPLQARFVWRRIDITVGQWLRALWPAASSTGVMAVAVLALLMARPVAHPIILLVLAIVTGALVYAGGLWFMHRAAAETAFRFVYRRRAPAVVGTAQLRGDPV